MGYPWVIQEIKNLLNTADNLQSQIDNFEAFPDYSDAEGLQLGIENGAPAWGDFTGAVRSDTLLAAQNAADVSGGSLGDANLNNILSAYEMTKAHVTTLEGNVTTLEGNVGTLKSGSGFNAAGKAEIVGWGMPDYSAGIRFTALTYTAPADGWVYYNKFMFNNVGCTLTVNGNTVAYMQTAGTNFDISLTGAVMVKAGDIINITGYAYDSNRDRFIFFPFRGL